MAVNRVWFPNAPSGSVDSAQRAQLGIGYSGITIAAAAFVFYESVTLENRITQSITCETAITKTITLNVEVG